jgi:hypothetical protein
MPDLTHFTAPSPCDAYAMALRRYATAIHKVGPTCENQVWPLLAGAAMEGGLS